MIKNLYDKIYRFLWLTYHLGTKNKCPFCGYTSNKLLPFGISSEVIEKYHIIGGGRREACCLRCGAHDRERLVFVYLKYVAKIFERPRLSIFHVAPEQRISNQILKHKNIEYICGDLFAEGYSYPSYVMNMNIINIPLEDNRFDIILCNHVLEHVPDKIQAMRELYRVLKPGGFAILQVPIAPKLEKTIEDFTITDPEERLKVFGQRDHCRIYGKDYTDFLQSVGFKVEQISISNDFSKYALNPEEKLFVCRK